MAVSNVLRVSAGGTVHDTNEHMRHANDRMPPQTMTVLLRIQQLDAHMRSHCLAAHRPSQITIAFLIIKSIVMIKEDKTIYKRLLIETMPFCPSRFYGISINARNLLNLV